MKLTDKQSIDILSKGIEFTKAIIDFQTLARKWSEYLEQYEEEDLIKLIESNEAHMNMHKAMQTEWNKLNELMD